MAFSPDLNGSIPVDPQVARLVLAAVRRLEDLGCLVEERCFDASDMREICAGTRAFGMVARYADLMEPHARVMTPVLARQVNEGLRTDVRTVVKAEKMRTAYWHRVRKFMQNYDYIVTPTIGAPAFRLDQPFPTLFGETKVEKFRDVFLFAYAFSITGLPAASVPCGFTPEGLPVGMQIVGHRLREDSVLEAASAYSGACPEHSVWPCINMKSTEWMTSEPLLDFP